MNQESCWIENDQNAKSLENHGVMSYNKLKVISEIKYVDGQTTGTGDSYPGNRAAGL